MLKPVERNSLSDQVFRQLRDGILDRTYTPGERLPSERELCERLGVNRSSVREAIKRLEQAGLIEVRHGGGSTVLDFLDHGGFDLLRELVMPGGQLDLVAVRSMLEFRAMIGPTIARYAARRVAADGLAELDSIVEALEACGPEELDRFQELDFAFNHAMARASKNLAFLLLMNSVKEAYLEHKAFFRAMFAGELVSRRSHRRILEALRAGEEARAEALCSEQMEEGNRAFWDLLSGLPGMAELED